MRQKTVLAVLVAGLVGYEAWTLNTAARGDTISEVVWSVSDRWPVIGLLFGLVMGHFFWPRRSVMGLLGDGAQPRQWQFQFEPARWLGLARTVIYVAGVFGLFGVDQWTEEQKGAAVILVEAVTTMIQRSFVTPNVKI